MERRTINSCRYIRNDDTADSFADVQRAFFANERKILIIDGEIDAGAQQVHGISLEFLQDKPKFADAAQDFLAFIAGGVLVIHNAPFDVGFLNHELARLNLAPVETCCEGVIDTLKLAKEFHPGQKNNLDALCKRYAVDNSNRTLHGALLDAELLAEVYLGMTRGQESLMIEMTSETQSAAMAAALIPSKPLVVLRASAEELALHDSLLAEIDATSKGACVWNKLG